jgi:hypothetical protein
MRHPLRLIASAALLAAIAGIVLALALGSTHKGTGVAPGASSKGGLHAVPLAQNAAHGYNPFGTGPENRDLVNNLVDSDPSTTWSTEQYIEGTLRKAGGTGTGFYLDAAPRVAARAVELQTPTPGFAVQLYYSDHIDLSPAFGSSLPLSARGWHGPVGASAHVRDGERIAVRAGARAHRYWLVWMTTLPPGRNSTTISDVTLFK